MINELFNHLCQNILAVTLYDLAPWIMIGITLWGIARLFSKNEYSCNSETSNEEKYEQADSDSYSDTEDENCDEP